MTICAKCSHHVYNLSNPNNVDAWYHHFPGVIRYLAGVNIKTNSPKRSKKDVN